MISSGIQVTSMQNVERTLKIVGRYCMRCVLYAKKHFTNCPSSSLLEEAKLNHSIINHDNAHVGTLHWWLVHRHNLFLLTLHFLRY